MTISHFHTRKIVFGPATPRAHPSASYPHTVCCQLTYEEDDIIQNHSSEDDILVPHLPNIAEEEDNDMEEHFPTISLDDNFWMEDPIPERHLCIHDDAQQVCPLSMPLWFKPATPCPGRCTVHGSQ